MALITRTNTEDSSTAILTVSGVFTYEDVIQALKDFYEGDVTPNMVWDFTDADLSEMTSEHLRLIVEFAVSKARLRKKGRTAFVATKDFEFGIARMFDTFAEMGKHTIPTYTFRDMDKAIEWINVE